MYLNIYIYIDVMIVMYFGSCTCSGGQRRMPVFGLGGRSRVDLTTNMYPPNQKLTHQSRLTTSKSTTTRLLGCFMSGSIRQRCPRKT